MPLYGNTGKIVISNNHFVLCGENCVLCSECPLSEVILYFCPLDVCRVLEVIIEEQVEKLQATLRGIETLSVVARHTASKLTELISSEEVC